LVRETTKTAAVSVKPEGSASLDESQVDSIRHWVAGAVAGLKYANVKVLDENSGLMYHGDAENGGGSMDEPYLAAKRRAEKHWTAQILRAVSYVPGVTVAVNVELEKELRRRETEHKPDQKAVAIRKKENTRSRTRDGSAPGGRAGFQANQPQALAASSSKGSHEEEEETTSTEENFLGTTSVEKEIPGLTPTLVKASIGVPTSYFEEVWRKRNPVQPGEQPKTPTQADLDQIRTQEIAQIKAAVVGLLPQPEKTTDMTQLVTVTPFQEIIPAPTPVPGLPVQTLDWLVQNWSMLGLIFLGGFSLVVLRSIARSAPASSPRPSSLPLSLDLPAPAQHAAEPREVTAAATTGATAAERRLRRVAAGGPSLRDELSEIVTEDPDAAAAILRTWIGNAR
jgi:flagellar M-ring protein FliF